MMVATWAVSRRVLVTCPVNHKWIETWPWRVRHLLLGTTRALVVSVVLAPVSGMVTVPMPLMTPMMLVTLRSITAARVSVRPPRRLGIARL